VDVDQFIRRNEPTWRHLDEAVRRLRSRRSKHRLDGAELDETIRLYQRVSGHLSYSRTWYGDSPVTSRLTALVGESRAVIHGPGDRGGNVLLRFFTHDFPGAVWRTRKFIAIAAFLLLAPAVYVGAWMTFSDAALDASAPPALRESYVQQDFADYYSSQPAAEFSTKVLVNNIQVSFMAYALGIFAGIGTVVVLVGNGLGIGQAAGLFQAAGQAPRFWGLILPHGLLEITAVCVAGGAGLKLGWAVVSPGDRTRSAAVAEEGRRSVPVVVGLILVFITAGLIEGFVTPSPLPTWERVGIGLVVTSAFLFYVFGLGRRVAAEDEATRAAGGLDTTGGVIVDR